MSKSPEATFRIGNCSDRLRSEMDGEGTTRKVRSVNVQKSDKDGDQRKFTSSFGLGELPSAIRVLQLAQQHIEKHEAEVTG